MSQLGQMKMKTSKRKGAIGAHLLLLEIVIFCVELLHLRHLVWHKYIILV